ncbi:hypothetical protein [Marivivens aquimaris]|uniref:hypothetical protein n=1 Tax=Marivivens aquimaris TaxID=2774876 RepID=UPI00188085BF|nr:hypothetical protein [Marivivens aquimaris]
MGLCFMVSAAVLVGALSLNMVGLVGLWGVIGLFMVTTLITATMSVLRSFREEGEVIRITAQPAIRRSF